jgi:hypothetical protein
MKSISNASRHGGSLKRSKSDGGRRKKEIDFKRESARLRGKAFKVGQRVERGMRREAKSQAKSLEVAQKKRGRGRWDSIKIACSTRTFLKGLYTLFKHLKRSLE